MTSIHTSMPEEPARTPWYLREVPRPVCVALLGVFSPLLVAVTGVLLGVLAAATVVPGVGITVALFPTVLSQGWRWWHVAFAITSGASLWSALLFSLLRLVTWYIAPPKLLQEIRAAMESLQPIRGRHTA